jgi:hypothetical protein
MLRVQASGAADQQYCERVLPIRVAFPTSVVSWSFTLFATFSFVGRAGVAPEH